MNTVQKLLVRLLPRRWAEDMEAESREWMIRCPTCGFARSVWNAGGIRWKAAGSPRRLLRCGQCGAQTWHVIARRTD